MIRIIREEDEAKAALIKAFDLSEVQAEAILNMRLRQLRKLEEFEDFVYGACLKDWKKESKKQTNLKKILDKGKHVRITGEDTDLSFSIEGRQGIKCDGKICRHLVDFIDNKPLIREVKKVIKIKSSMEKEIRNNPEYLKLKNKTPKSTAV